MKKMKLAWIRIACLCMVLGMTLSACGQKEEMPGDVSGEIGSPLETGGWSGSGEDGQVSDAKNRELTPEEIDFFDGYLAMSGNVGFLLSSYSSAEDIDLNELFYSGAGISKGFLTQEEREDYLRVSGDEEIYTDVVALTAAQIDGFLLEKTGLSKAQMKKTLDWVYSQQTDTWYHQAGDTNLRNFRCVGGTVMGDTYALRMQVEEGFNGYRPEIYETVLRKNGNAYQFVSNRFLEEEGRIEDQTFEITLAPWGKVTFASYLPQEPGTADDVTFRILQDGKLLMTLRGVSDTNYRASQIFLEVEAVSFPDFNSDGYTDLITIASYAPFASPDEEARFTEARIYSGNQYGYFTYERDLSEELNSNMEELTIRRVLEFLGADGGQGAAGGQNASGGQDVSGGNNVPDDREGMAAAKTGTAWKDAYIEILRNADPYQWSGFTLIYLDDDDVPELIMAGIDEATGNVLMAYTEDGVKENQLRRLYFSYIERGSQLCNSEGLMDYYYDLVFRFQDGQLILTDEGYFGAEDNSNVQFDENGERIYQYEWNGKRVTKEEYAKELQAVYDESKAKDCYDWRELYSAEELIQELINGR